MNADEEGAAADGPVAAGDDEEVALVDGADSHDVGQPEPEAAPTVPISPIPLSPVPTTFDLSEWAGGKFVLIGLIFNTPLGSSTYFLTADSADRLADRLRHSARDARHRERTRLTEVRKDVLEVIQGNGSGKKLLLPPGA
jgi:hypothetical protein